MTHRLFRPTSSRSAALALGAACALALPASSARANAPAGRYTIASGTVTDTATKLVWQQAVDPGMWTWQDAQSYCAGLALAGGGWRVPSVNELMTLIDFSVAGPGPTIDATAFPGTPAESFWSSSLVGTANASFVYFSSGSAYYADVTVTYRVRCVR